MFNEARVPSQIYDWFFYNNPKCGTPNLEKKKSRRFIKFLKSGGGPDLQSSTFPSFSMSGKLIIVGWGVGLIELDSPFEKKTTSPLMGIWGLSLSLGVIVF